MWHCDARWILRGLPTAAKDIFPSPRSTGGAGLLARRKHEACADVTPDELSVIDATTGWCSMPAVNVLAVVP